jgi:hypothetical protein
MGGRPLEDVIKHRRWKARQVLEAEKACKKRTRNKGSGVFIFCNQKLAEYKALHPQKLSFRELLDFKKAAAAEYKLLSEHQQRDIKDQVCSTFCDRYISQMQEHADGTFSEDDNCEIAGPFVFGCKEWPLAVERLQTDFADTYGCKVSDHISGGILRAAQIITADESNSPFINDKESIIPAKISCEFSCYDLHPGLCATLQADIVDVALDISDGLAEFIKAGHCKPGKTLVALTGLAPDQPTVILCALMSYHLKSPDKIGFMMMSFEPCPGAFFPFDARPSTTAAAHGFSAFTSHTHFGLAELLARQAEGKLDFSWTIQQVNYQYDEIGTLRCCSWQGDPAKLFGAVKAHGEGTDTAQGKKLMEKLGSDDEDIASWKNAMKEPSISSKRRYETQRSKEQGPLFSVVLQSSL